MDGTPDCEDTEECDGVDNDGDGEIDEGFDSDMDGTPDCADEEICDGVDNDGDDLVDEGFDSDMDGTPDCEDEEVCDGVDNDGDGEIDEGFDSDMDGTPDCEDEEECDGLDNDGDGDIDEGFDANANGIPDCTEGTEDKLPTSTTVKAYHIPFENSVNLDIEIPYNALIEVEFLDMSGRLVMKKRAGKVTPGKNVLPIKVYDLATGVHVMRISTGKEVIKQKVYFHK